jgi:hypothetical protein
MAKVFPTAAPALNLWTAVLLDRRGAKTKARARCQISLAVARALRMPYDEALAESLMVSLSENEDRATTHRKAAGALVTRLGVTIQGPIGRRSGRPGRSD